MCCEHATNYISNCAILTNLL